MRISLLQKREPFAEVLLQTLTPWWSVKYGQEFDIRWTKAAPSGPGQRWYCNAYLNSIFPEGVDPRVFGPIRNEFSYARVAWRRPLQRAAVALATRPPLMYLACTSRLQVLPEVPNSRFLLVIPGNHKLRILDWREQMVDVVLKSEYDASFLSNEIETRSLARDYGIRVPAITEVVGSAGRDPIFGFREEYVNGVPLNRLKEASEAQRHLESALRQLDQLATATTEICSVEDYVEQLHSEVVTQVGQMSLPYQDREFIRSCADELRDLAVQLSAFDTMETVLSHGDFQPANILVDGSESWLIDWEYSTRRQAAYDRLVFHSQSRFSDGLAKRLNSFVTAGRWSRRDVGTDTIGGERLSTPAARQQAISIFLLEEMSLHARENANPRFVDVGYGFKQIPREAREWLRSNSKIPSLSCSS